MHWTSGVHFMECVSVLEILRLANNNNTTECAVAFLFAACPSVYVLLHVRITGTEPDCSPHHKELIDLNQCRAAPLLRAAAETSGGQTPELQPTDNPGMGNVYLTQSNNDLIKAIKQHSLIKYLFLI